MSEQVYVSHKKVKRTPMNRQQYNDYRGWVLPADEDGTDDGYLVEYLDGGKPNHPDHEGYISWSPKEQFDNGYQKVLLPHQERVVKEKADLDENILRLIDFQADPFYESICEEEQERMDRQKFAMIAYSNCLAERIEAF